MATTPKIRSKHALGLALICGTVALIAAYLYGFSPRLSDYRGEVDGDSLPLQMRVRIKIGEAVRRVEFKTTDLLQIYGRKGSLPNNVVFLPIDTPSTTLGNLGNVSQQEIDQSQALRLMANEGFPYPRATYSFIIDRLIRAGARVVAFDMRFPAPKAGDELFAEALAAYKDKVVIGSNLTEMRSDMSEISITNRRPSLEPPAKSLIPEGGYDQRVGFVNFRTDEDGAVRYSPFRTTLLEYFGEPPLDNDRELWSLAAQIARQAGYESLIPPEHGPRMIRFIPKINPLSLFEIFVDRTWQNPPYRNGEVFKDKIVLIGPFGNWVKDDLPTPFGDMLGPQMHLSALAAILNKDYLTESSPRLDVLLILLAGVVAFGLSVTVGDPGIRTVLLIVVAVAYISTAFVLFNTTGYCLKLLIPNAVLLFGGFVALAWERIVERKERNRVRSTLERYVSKDVVKEVLDNPESYLNTLSGVSRKPITLLFSDVRGFTTLTESGDANEIVTQLNEYFTEMVRIVFAHLGTLDKFMGDAVMASWGAIESRGAGPDAGRAVAAALDMLRILKVLNIGWKKRGLLEMKIGIGVNHGDAICGNIGSEEKREFTAIGDAVNTASRLEGATKQYHVDLLIGEQTAPLVRDSFTLRSIDLLQLKGKNLPVEVYTVLDLRDAGNVVPAWLAPYEDGVRLYRQRSFAEAERQFLVALAGAPEDWLIQEYLRRAQLLIAEPPGPEWNGVFVMSSK